MPIFVLLSLIVLLVSAGIIWGLVRYATSKLQHQAKRTVRFIAIACMFVGTAIYCYIVVLILYSQFDHEDFWSPSEQS